MKKNHFLLAICLLFSSALFSQSYKYFDEFWRQDYGKAINGEIADVEIDGNNNIIILGQHLAVGGNEIRLHCVHASGATLWANPCSGAIGNNRAVDITLDNNNNIYALFSSENTTNTTITISKFTMQGSLIWSKTEVLPIGSKANKILLNNNRVIAITSKNTNGNMSLVVYAKNANNGNNENLYI